MIILVSTNAYCVFNDLIVSVGINHHVSNYLLAEQRRENKVLQVNNVDMNLMWILIS